MVKKGPKWQEDRNFFSGASSSKQNEKNEHCYIEFCPVVGKIQLVTD